MMRFSLGAFYRAALVWCALAAAADARELDPAACGARFDVQRDKIIRTEESREMGARYLSELDVGARHECLRLCCETDSCDVFVYEEKSPGSCYLFNCGPPEDFRCKFTAHGNFSSGVLALSRRLAELQDQERLAHHEQQLASLRGTAPSTTAATTTGAPAATAPAPPPLRPPDPPRRCSRYQFECRRGGECIAVYNACDGVPQCADGSDEAPELGCPAPAPAPAPLPAPRATPPPAPRATPPPAPRATPPPPPPPPPMLRPMQVLGDPLEAENAVGGGAGAAGGAAGAEPEPQPERWPHRLAQAQPPPHRYNAAEVSHIFSHKGGLLQEAEAPPYAPFDAPSPWVRRLWTQPQQGVEWGAPGGWGEADPRRAWPVPPRPEMPVYVPGKTMPELPLEYAGGAPAPALRDAPKKGPAPAPPTAPAPPPATPAPAPAAAHPEHHHESAASGAGASASTSTSTNAGASASASAVAGSAPLADQRDGLSDHSPAAILLLVLGVAMTGVLGALVGCRARAARRRHRRGKSPLAHDADYLVNGMYL